MQDHELGDVGKETATYTYTYTRPSQQHYTDATKYVLGIQFRTQLVHITFTL